VVHRLFASFLMCVGLSLVCWWVLPKFGLLVPAWLPLAGFAIILVAILIASAPPSDPQSDDDPLDDAEPHESIGPYRFRDPHDG
jgi:hypothetical protein